MDHIDPICPFDASQYTGTPDAEPCGRSLPVRERIGRFKYTAPDQIDAEYQSVLNDLATELSNTLKEAI